jgi:TIR domain/Protein kinase domain
MRMGAHLALIDLDAAVPINNFLGIKFSSAYLPPEMIYQVKLNTDTETFGVKRYSADAVKAEMYDPVIALPSHDSWSLGIVLYHLMSGQSLFHGDVHDNIAGTDIKDLYECAPDFIQRRLEGVSNTTGRNLIAQLLHKDPTMRLSATNAKYHPFLTGRAASRMVGQSADYDVFISYRVASDSEYAKQCYTQLTDAGLRVWWDKVCLKPGISWEDGFMDGLLRSRIFLPLLSREGINHPAIPWQNFSKLTSDSRCDNVLLEYRLSLELLARGLLDAVYPVMIGKVENQQDNPIPELVCNYWATECHPDLSQVSSVVVHSVEDKLVEHLHRQGLGTPLADKMTVKAIVDKLTLNQGYIANGPKHRIFEQPEADVKQMITRRPLESTRQSVTL